MKLWKTAGVAILILIGIAAYWEAWRPGVRVTVKNRGPEPLTGATVTVEGDSDTIGAVPPGRSRSVCVRPTDESEVTVEVQVNAGEPIAVTPEWVVKPEDNAVLMLEFTGTQLTDFEFHRRMPRWP